MEGSKKDYESLLQRFKIAIDSFEKWEDDEPRHYFGLQVKQSQIHVYFINEYYEERNFFQKIANPKIAFVSVEERKIDFRIP